MSKLDRVIGKLNIHGCNPGELFGGGVSDLTTQDVYAALAFGQLRLDSYVIGLAVHTNEPHITSLARIQCAHIVREAGAMYDWSWNKPYHNEVRDLVARGALMPDEAAERKRVLGRRLVFNLGALALYEATGPHAKKCHSCSGQGFTWNRNKKATCTRCSGSGRHVHVVSDLYRSERVYLNYDAWMKTWRPRYKICLSEVLTRVIEFNDHLETKC